MTAVSSKLAAWSALRDETDLADGDQE